MREPKASGAFNARAVDGSPNLLLRAGTRPVVLLAPAALAVVGGAAGFGPYTVNVSLSRPPSSTVTATLALSDGSRGRVSPARLTFGPGDWAAPRAVSVDARGSLWGDPSPPPLWLTAELTSDDVTFDGTKPRLRVDDRRGDTVLYPKVIRKLPFRDAGDTYFFGDSYYTPCGDAGSPAGLPTPGDVRAASGAVGGDDDGDSSALDAPGGKDVVYYFAPTRTGVVTASLCGGPDSGAARAFDAKMFVLADLGAAGAPAAPATVIACSDDACGYSPAVTWNATAGVAYGIVIDGVDGRFGPYTLDVTAEGGGSATATPPPAGYGINWPTVDPALVSGGAALARPAAPRRKAYPPTPPSPLPPKPGKRLPPPAPPAAVHVPLPRAAAPGAAPTQPARQLGLAPGAAPGLGAAPVGVAWLPCGANGNSTSGGGGGARSVACASPAGALLAASACAPADMDAAQRIAGAGMCPAVGGWTAGPWGACSAACGGGKATRSADCPSPPCDASSRPPTDRACNSAPCDPVAWRVGPWEACTVRCGGGGRTARRVDCARAADGGGAPDAACAAAAPKPAATAACGGEPCDFCAAQAALADGGCSGRGDCDRGACRCRDGATGRFCEAPSGCASGVADASGACCPGGAVAADGACCPDGAPLDAAGACCAGGRVDACGVCGGNGTAVDGVGACCAGVLDAAGLCCASRRLDACGVCDGDGGSCGVTVRASGLGADPAAAAATALGVARSSVSLAPRSARRAALAAPADVSLVIAAGAKSTLNGSASIFLSPAAAAAALRSAGATVATAAATPVCGNGVCEASEAVHAGGACPRDCPLRLAACPAAGGAPCGGRGACLAAAAACACHAGYAGAACAECAPGHYPAGGGACAPLPAEQAAVVAAGGAPPADARPGRGVALAVGGAAAGVAAAAALAAGVAVGVRRRRQAAGAKPPPPPPPSAGPGAPTTAAAARAAVGLPSIAFSEPPSSTAGGGAAGASRAAGAWSVA